MFTGLIEETGRVKSIVRGSSGARIDIAASKVLKEAKKGDSICVSGVCLTVITFSSSSFSADISQETLKKTIFSAVKPGTAVNLERALSLGDRLGGHIVSGHVDSTGKIKSIRKEGDSYLVRFTADKDFTCNISEKGSVTVNGISLTAFDVDNEGFSVAVIPHTFKSTDLSLKKPGDSVNLESDMLLKMLLKKTDIPVKTEKENRGISMNTLMENGFI